MAPRIIKKDRPH